jgi:DNA polymerase delta subunit 2
METCPHLYVAGNQPAFATRAVSGPDGQRVRLVAVPAFADSCELVLVDAETLAVDRVRFVGGDVIDVSAGGEGAE